MAFSCKVYNIIAFANQFVDDFLIPDVSLDKGVVVIILNVCKVFKVSAVSQGVKVYYMVI